MKVLSVILLTIFISGCTDTELVRQNAQKLCSCRASSVWWIDDNDVKCTDGTWFWNVDRIEIVDTCKLN